MSLWFGRGKLNASRAVQQASPRTEEVRTVDVSAQPNLPIPDVGTAVQSTIQVHHAGTNADLRVQVNITDTYIGDLRVDLIAPDGSSVTLHNNTGGPANDLVTIYSVAEVPALHALVGRSVQGAWQLRVRDSFRFDVGRVNSWRLVARLQA